MDIEITPENTNQALPGTPPKTQRIASTAYGLCYAAVFPALQQIAREHGYALAVHGSLGTDMDMIACPWIEEASDPEVMIEAIRDAIDGVITIAPTPGEKPHGRLAWNIMPSAWVDGRPIGLKWRPWLDISVMPRLK